MRKKKKSSKVRDVSEQARASTERERERERERETWSKNILRVYRPGKEGRKRKTYLLLEYRGDHEIFAQSGARNL